MKAMNSKTENIRNKNDISSNLAVMEIIFARRASISIEKQRNNKQIARRALTN